MVGDRRTRFALVQMVLVALALVAVWRHRAVRWTDAEPRAPAATGFVTRVEPDFELDGQGTVIDSLAFWEGPDPADTLLFVTAKGNQRVEVWRYPFVGEEQAPIRHASFGSGTHVNGVAVDQSTDRLYVTVGEPASTVSVFALPNQTFVDEFIEGAVNLKGEPNIALLRHVGSGRTRAYVSADTIVYLHDGATGDAIHSFEPVEGLETIAADDFYQRLYIPDENGGRGVYVYDPDGKPYRGHGNFVFGQEDVFQADEEGILVYTCPGGGRADSGGGFIVVADQRSSESDFEFFDRITWDHLGTLNIVGVSNTDGIASTQQPLPDYPLGLFAVVNDDTSVMGVGWNTVMAVTGLTCGIVEPTPTRAGAPTPTSRPTATSDQTATASPARSATPSVTTNPTLSTARAATPTPRLRRFVPSAVKRK